MALQISQTFAQHDGLMFDQRCTFKTKKLGKDDKQNLSTTIGKLFKHFINITTYYLQVICYKKHAEILRLYFRVFQ